MYRKLVEYDNWHFAEVDPIRLKRKALILRDQINQKIKPDNDPYQFYSRTLPVIEAAIRGEIRKSLDERITKFISGNYDHDRREGNLPASYDYSFKSAVGEFAATATSLSVEQSQHEIIDGVTYGWMNCEEESDWPDKMPYP